LLPPETADAVDAYDLGSCEVQREKVSFLDPIAEMMTIVNARITRRDERAYR
jgi:hypothetical protein